MPGPQTEDTGVAARMLVNQMQRERRSFWGILGVFFLLLAGIGGMLAYQIFALRTFSEESRLQRFTEIGAKSRDLSDLRDAQDQSAVKLREAANLTSAAQAATSVAFDALHSTPDSLVPDALVYAQKHFLGRSLNQSTALVLTGALKSERLTPAQAALMKAALLDWSIPSSMLIDTVAPEQIPHFDLIDANAQVLLADPDPAMNFFGHAVRAARFFLQVSNGGRNDPPLPYMSWDNGCKELVDEATEALKLAPQVLGERVGDAQASGLNLNYWRGQCWRRKGEPYLARDEFAAMMRVAETDAIPKSNPLKYQAFHGMGTVLTTLLDMDEKPAEQRQDELARAKSYLTDAGKFRMAAGTTEVGAVSSLGNLGFLLLKDDTPTGLAAVLDHTTKVDDTLSSTWNLVAQLAAIRAIQALDEEQRALVPGEAYSDEKLDALLFKTLAELAYQDKASLPATEFGKILDKKHYPALEEAKACIGEKEGCYEKLLRE